jgi:hypothetical protein
MKKLAALIPLILLAACSKPAEQTHTVSEYFKNPALMKADHKNCHDNYGSIGQTPNCQNNEIAYVKYGQMTGFCDFQVQIHKFATLQACSDDYYAKWVSPK